MVLWDRTRTILLEQRGHLFCWLPVAMAIGIALYFSLKFEPTAAHWLAVAGLTICALTAARFMGEAMSPFATFAAMVLIGAAIAGWRAHSVAGPVLDWRYYGPVEGRVIAIDRSASDALRITFDQVRLNRVAPEETPTRVRLSLHGDAELGDTPRPGLRMMTTAHLSPPGGPVEPGGFDFQRHAWFMELGAVGYTRVPVLTVEPVAPDLRLLVFQIRMAVSEQVRSVLPGDVGGFAAAVTTGDRSGIGQEALDDLRAANTAHLLAISGLHMGLLTAFVFGLLRYGLALIPAVALRYPTRKLAAVGALGAAAVYLALSGGNVATERAFIMAAVALSAILVDRRAISLRSVAIAALIVLSLRPEALLSPGFQMSFAATTALVAVFGWMRDEQIRIGPKWAQGVVGVILASAISGLATAPVGAAHFNTVSHYGLIANLLSVPVMGILVVPMAVFAALLAPLGLEQVGLQIMGFGLGWILWVSATVADLEGARSFVPGPGPAVLPLIALGALFVILWRGRLRWCGVAPIVLAVLLWSGANRPPVLIAEAGTIVGVMSPEGRALSKARGGGFVATNWLENDGDAVDQAGAAARWPEGPVSLKNYGDITFVHLSGKRAAAAFDGCDAGQVVVSSVPLDATGCEIFDPPRLRSLGALAFIETADGLQSWSSRDVTGTRLWSQWPSPDPAER